MFWGLKHPDRLQHERAQIEELAGEVDWIGATQWRLDDELRLTVNVDIVINDVTYEVLLVYPHLFPDTPAFVRPRLTTATTRWSAHQYGAGGTLCLEWGPDNWRPEVTGALLLRSAHRLLEAEAGAGSTPADVPSRHRETLGQAVRGQVYRLVVTDHLREWLDRYPLESQASLVTHNMYHRVTDVFFVSEAKPSTGGSVIFTDLPAAITTSFPLFVMKGTGWVFKSARFTGGEQIENLESLLAVLHGAGFAGFALPNTEGDTEGRADYIFLLRGSNNVARAFSYMASNGGNLKECAILGLTSTIGERIPSGYVELVSKKVGIVGLGSVGSKIAISLARSGLRKFVLIDDDLMLQENVCRHELDWVSVGLHKADAVKQAINVVAPEADVHVRRFRIAGQESAESASTALDSLATCDVIIDATANPEVFVQLAAIAKSRQRVLIWGELLAGGIGGLLARSRPGKDLDPLTMRGGIYDFLASKEPAPFAFASTGYDVEREAAPPLIAIDGEVSQLASSMTRFALDALLDRNPSEFPYSAYLIGFKQTWIFSAPFDTYPISVEGKVVNSPDPLRVEESTQRGAVEFISELVTQRTNADSRPAE